MSATTGFFTDERFLDHDTGAGHPERPDRLRSIIRHLKGEKRWETLAHPEFEPATEDQILAVHTDRYVRFVREACAGGQTLLDEGDTHVCAASYDCALLAAGAAVSAVDAVMSGSLRNAFCAVRPPGHHACPERAMGFCLFNTIAVAARHARIAHHIGRVAIVDWDVHHGNGTQEIFYDDPSVLFISLHQFPLWPGTGSRSQRGTGAGTGTTINIPMRPGSGEREYIDAFQHEVIPALAAFRPGIILVSAGFDAHRADPLAQIELTESSFTRLTEFVVSSAAEFCGNRIVSLLEGGYDLEALAKSVEAHLDVLSGAG